MISNGGIDLWSLLASLITLSSLTPLPPTAHPQSIPPRITPQTKTATNKIDFRHKLDCPFVFYASLKANSCISKFYAVSILVSSIYWLSILSALFWCSCSIFLTYLYVYIYISYLRVIIDYGWLFNCHYNVEIYWIYIAIKGLGYMRRRYSTATKHDESTWVHLKPNLRISIASSKFVIISLINSISMNNFVQLLQISIIKYIWLQI